MECFLDRFFLVGLDDGGVVNDDFELVDVESEDPVAVLLLRQSKDGVHAAGEIGVVGMKGEDFGGEGDGVERGGRRIGEEG